LSRHRKVQCSRSRAVALIAAGAVTLAAAATAATTWTSGPSRSIASPAHDAGAGSLLTVSGQMLQMQAFQQSTTSQAVQAYQIRDTAAQLAAAHWAAARAAGKTAVIRAVTTASRSSAASRPARKKKTASGSPRQIAEAMLASFGWSSGQFSCLDPLWAHESGWSVTAYNAGSGAYGIPQALPGSRMASAGPNWQTNAATQIRWGLEYIKGTYGSPCAAWGHEQATGWY
jgi:hypothetical protein